MGSRALMGLIKNQHGVYCAQQKVPVRLQTAVAQVLGGMRPKQQNLKRSLGTKDLKEANVRAKPVLAEFDRIIRDATARVDRKFARPPQRKTLNTAEIRRMAETLYAKLLADDEDMRFGGKPYWTKLHARVLKEDSEAVLAYPLAALPEHGILPEQLAQQKQNLVSELDTMQEALALGDISAVVDDVQFLLADFQIDLDTSSESYRALGVECLRYYVRALKGLEQRNAGEPIETPAIMWTLGPSVTGGGTFRSAVEGWVKERKRPDNTVTEYKRAVEMFIQLHGDHPILDIKRSHARTYREALQEVPQRRNGALREATLPELAAWGRKHADAKRVSTGTVNKQLGALQAIAEWAREHGVISDDVPWSNPFAKMRLQGEHSERTSFVASELQLLFAAPIFTKHEHPKGGRGTAAFWLPLLALFTGARQSELAGLTVADLQLEPETETPLLYIVSDTTRGKRLNTKGSQRVVPVHAQLVRLGFLAMVEEVRQTRGEKAFLFPLIDLEAGRSGIAAWSKWFGRYLRSQGVTDTNKVFHSLRHGFKDAMRRGEVGQEVHDALMGQAHASTVSGGYGAKQMLDRFGIKVLRRAVAKVAYPGLDLSQVKVVAAANKKVTQK